MSKSHLPFTKTNYLIMLTGIGLIILGFILMANDSEPDGFGFISLTLSPIIVMSGFIIQFIAITYKKKSQE